MAQRSPAPFLRKTWEIVSDPNNESVISWSSQGTSFVVWKPAEFAKDILPAHFKHCNFSSFVRQLNTYGFRKVDPDRWEFANDSFQRHNKDLMMGIVRRKPHTTAGPMAVGSGSGMGNGGGGGGGGGSNSAGTSHTLGYSHNTTHPHMHASPASGPPAPPLASHHHNKPNGQVLDVQPAPAAQEFNPNPAVLDATYGSGQLSQPSSQAGSLPGGQLPILPLMPGPMPMANLGPVASHMPGGLAMTYQQLSSSEPGAMFESVMEMMAAQQQQQHNHGQTCKPSNVILHDQRTAAEPWCDNSRVADASEQCSDSNRNGEELGPARGVEPARAASGNFPDRAAALLDAVALAQQLLPPTDQDGDEDAMDAADDVHGATPPAVTRSVSHDLPQRQGRITDVVHSQNKLSTMIGNYLRPGQQVMASITGEQDTAAVAIPGNGCTNHSGHLDHHTRDGPKSLPRSARDGHEPVLASAGAYTTSGTSSGNRTDTMGSEPGFASGSGDGGDAGNMDVEEMSKVGKRQRAVLYSNHSEAADGVGLPTVIPVPGNTSGRPYTGSADAHSGMPIKPKPQSMPHITHGILAEMAGQLGRLATLAHQVEELKSENMELRRSMERLRHDQHTVGRRQASLVANNTQTDPGWPHHKQQTSAVPGSSNASGDPATAQHQREGEPSSQDVPQSEAEADLPGSANEVLMVDDTMMLPMDGGIIQTSHEAGRTYVTGSYEGRPPSESAAVARLSPVSAPGLMQLSAQPGPDSVGVAMDNIRNARSGSTELGTAAGTPTTSSSMQAGGGGGTCSMELGDGCTVSGAVGSGRGPARSLSTAELENLLLDQQQKYSALKLRSDDVEAQMAAARQQSLMQQQRTEALQAQVAVAAKASLDTVELAKTLQEALAAQYTTAAVADARSKDLEARLRAQETENMTQKHISAVLQAKISALEHQLRGLSQMVGNVEAAAHSNSHRTGSSGQPDGNAAGTGVAEGGQIISAVGAAALLPPSAAAQYVEGRAHDDGARSVQQEKAQPDGLGRASSAEDTGNMHAPSTAVHVKPEHMDM